MTAIETLIKVAKNTSDINEVLSDIAEYWVKQKPWSRDIIWKAASKISPMTWWIVYCSQNFEYSPNSCFM